MVEFMELKLITMRKVMVWKRWNSILD